MESKRVVSWVSGGVSRVERSFLSLSVFFKTLHLGILGIAPLPSVARCL